MAVLGRLAAAASVAAMMTMTAIAVLPAPMAHGGSAASPPAYTITGSAVTEACQLVRVDITTGATTVLGAPPSSEACVTDLAVAPDGSVWGIRETESLEVLLVEFDPATGAVRSSGPFTGNFSAIFLEIGAVAFDGTGTLYAQLVTDEPGCDLDFVCLYTVDPQTRVATFVGAAGPEKFETVMLFLAADCGTSMVTTEFTGDLGEAGTTSWGDADVGARAFGLQLDSVDKATGVVTDGPPFALDLSLAGLDYSRADGTLYALGGSPPVGQFGESEATPPTSAGEDPATEGEADAAEGDVGAADVNASIFVVDPATAAVTEVVALDRPDLEVGVLGIGGQCAGPAPTPLVIEPRFTG